ncbi:melanopsin-A-like [Saccostrea cucullata]|uniref:melanopsin-A-like n=1 Tax=Saccostrea cuccullata TaxID=36930 RepID=UPI002ED224C6
MDSSTDFSSSTSIPNQSKSTAEDPSFDNTSNFQTYGHGDNFDLVLSFPCTENFPYRCPTSVVTLLVFLLGIIGNTAVIVIMKRKRLFRKTSHMCILILAINDSWSLLCNITREFVLYPNLDYFRLKFGFFEPFCVIFFVLFYTPYLCSSINIVFMAYERYILVTNPLEYMKTHTTKRAVFRALIAFITFLIINTSYAIVMSETSKCPDYLFYSEYYAFISVPFIVLSSVLLLLFHCLKIVKLSKLQILGTKHLRNAQSHWRMTKIVYVIVIIYILSQIPYVVYDIISTCDTFGLFVWPEKNYAILLEYGIVIFLMNYAVNPFIYWLTPLRCNCNPKSLQSTSDTSNTISTIGSPDS